MLIFVHGKIGLSSPPPGRPYWLTLKGDREGFIKGAKSYFHDSQTWFTHHDFHFLSTIADRKSAGQRYARHHLQQWEAILKPGEPVHFIAHSMGCAFAEGIAQFLFQKGFQIGGVLHINCFQAALLPLSSDNRQWTVDYQFTDDPLINNPVLKWLKVASPGSISEVTAIHEQSGIRNPLYRHRGPIGIYGEGFWEKMSNNKHLQISHSDSREWH